MKTEPNDAAFPISSTTVDLYGLTKREWMATMILSGIIAHYGSDMIQRAVEEADSLIAALNKTGTNS